MPELFGTLDNGTRVYRASGPGSFLSISENGYVMVRNARLRGLRRMLRPRACAAAQKLYRRPHTKMISAALTSLLTTMLRALSEVVDRIALINKDSVSHPADPRFCICPRCTSNVLEDFEFVEIRDPRIVRRAQNKAVPEAWEGRAKLNDTDAVPSPLRKITRRFRLSGKRDERRMIMRFVATEAVDAIAAIARRFNGLDFDGARGAAPCECARPRCPLTRPRRAAVFAPKLARSDLFPAGHPLPCSLARMRTESTAFMVGSFKGLRIDLGRETPGMREVVRAAQPTRMRVLVRRCPRPQFGSHVIASTDRHPCDASHTAAALNVVHHIESLQLHFTSIGGSAWACNGA